MSGRGGQVVALRLTAASTHVPLGQAPRIAIEAVNRGTDPIWLIGVLDGSESGARYPRWIPSVQGPEGPLPSVEMPDFASPLLPGDFRRLEPGEGFDPTAAVDGAAYQPLALFRRIGKLAGRYRLRLELDTEAPDEAAWFGSLPDRRKQAAAEAAAARRLLPGVPRLRVRSNVLVLQVGG